MDWTPHPDVVYTRLDDKEGVLLNLRSKRYYSLNETGLVIWESVQQGHSSSEAAEALTVRYEVEQEAAAHHTEHFFEMLREEGLIEPAGV